MYSIEVVASDFDGKMKIKQHQLVTRLIADDVKQWHGGAWRGARGRGGAGARGRVGAGPRGRGVRGAGLRQADGRVRARHAQHACILPAEPPQR
jgi:hypothetical protein